jgi:hypothetical protein
MAGMSDYLENKLIDFVFRGQTFTPPTTLYVALFTTADNDAGSTRVEVSGGAYARAAIASSAANWAATNGPGVTTPASSGNTGTTSNNNAIPFPTPTANWGTVQGIGIMDAATGGNELWYSPLSTPQTINNGQTAPQFNAAALSIQIDG